MSDVLRELVVKLGFDVNDSALTGLDQKIEHTKHEAHGFGKELEEVFERVTAFKSWKRALT